MRKIFIDLFVVYNKNLLVLLISSAAIELVHFLLSKMHLSSFGFVAFVFICTVFAVTYVNKVEINATEPFVKEFINITTVSFSVDADVPCEVSLYEGDSWASRNLVQHFSKCYLCTVSYQAGFYTETNAWVEVKTPKTTLIKYTHSSGNDRQEQIAATIVVGFMAAILFCGTGIALLFLVRDAYGLLRGTRTKIHDEENGDMESLVETERETDGNNDKSE